MDKLFGMKDLYDVTLKATYPIEIGGKSIETNEIIAAFDKIAVANIDELVERAIASGGYENRTLIIWETPKQINISFSQGVFSKKQLAILMNNRMIINGEDSPVEITKREVLSSDENGIISLEKIPKDGHIFIYNNETNEKIKEFTLENNLIKIKEPSLKVNVDYSYEYESKSISYVGRELISGFVSLEGKTRIKEDISGQIVTGILKIPRLKILSDLSMRLGNGVDPMVGVFQGAGFPSGARGDTKAMELTILDREIK